MPRKRQPREIWKITRLRIWQRDNGRCQSPLEPPICEGKPEIAFDKCNIDHIQSGKNGTNHDSNLRVLCPMCHALRQDRRHDGLRGKLLAADRLPRNWKDLLWEG